MQIINHFYIKKKKPETKLNNFEEAQGKSYTDPK